MESFLTSSIYHMLRLEVQVAVDQVQRRAGLVDSHLLRKERGQQRKQRGEDGEMVCC